MSHLKPWANDLLVSRLRSDLRGVIEVANSMLAGLDGRPSAWNLQDLEALVASMRRANDEARTPPVKRRKPSKKGG